MADSTYNILEYRAVVRDEQFTDLYVLIDNPTDFMPIGGWYHKAIDAATPSLQALSEALATSDYLRWDRRAPDDSSKFLQDEVTRMREELMDVHMELAKRMMSNPIILDKKPS